MNPAMAGVEGPGKLFAGYRNQGIGSLDNYLTYHASYEQGIDAIHGGIGVHLMNDRLADGVFNNISLDAMYSFHLKVSRFLNLTGGLQASVGQRTRNSSNLVLPDMIQQGTGNILPGSEPIEDYSKIYPDFSVGFAGFYKDFYGGLAVHHLATPKVSESGDPNTRLARKYTLHAGALIPIYERRLGKEVLQLSPNVIFIQQQSYQQLNYGMEVIYKNLIGGIWGRQDLLFSYGTIIFSLGNGTDQYRFRYSYDAKLSRADMNIPNMGAHEISLIIIFESLDKSMKHSAIKCPKI